MEIPHFSETDDPAIQRRLSIFETKSLANPIPKANEWLRKHCMQIFHYLAHELHDEPLFRLAKITYINWGDISLIAH